MNIKRGMKDIIRWLVFIGICTLLIVAVYVVALRVALILSNWSWF